MDKALNACVCGGVEMLGLHASVAPRKQQLQHPVLEEYVFVPYQREVTVENGQEYLDKCLKCTHAGLESWLGNGLKIPAQSRDTLSDCLQALKQTASTATDVTHASEDRQPLLCLLQDVFSLEHDGDFIGNLNNTVESYREKLDQDPLLGCVKTVENIKPILDVISRALPPGQTLRIVELGRGSMAKHVLPLLSDQPTLNFDYTIVTSSNEEDQTQEIVNQIVWDKKTGKIPEEMKIANLVVIDQSALSGRLCQFLEANSELDNDIMLLVHGATANHELAVVVDVFESKLSSANNVVRDVFDAARVIEECASYQFELTAQVSTQLLQSLFLFQRKRDTLHTLHGQRQITVTSADFDWLPTVQAAMGNSEDLWLLARDPGNSSGLVGMVNCLRAEPGGENVRFDNTIFLFFQSDMLASSQTIAMRYSCCIMFRCIVDLDGTATDADIEEQMKKRLAVNVFSGGQWGFFCHLPLKTGWNICRCHGRSAALKVFWPRAEVQQTVVSLLYIFVTILT